MNSFCSVYLIIVTVSFEEELVKKEKSFLSQSILRVYPDLFR